MRYVARCCRVVVLARRVWAVLGVPDPEERCPVCGRWTKFDIEQAGTCEVRGPLFDREAA